MMEAASALARASALTVPNVAIVLPADIPRVKGESHPIHCAPPISLARALREGTLADTFKKESENSETLDLRLIPIAVVVRTGQAVERHWEFFKTTYFPGMADEAAQAALLAWAERNGIKASLRVSCAHASGSGVSHVRLTQS
jgi:hypothetical protein